MAKYRWISQLQRRLRNLFKLVWLTMTKRLRRGLRSIQIGSRQAQGSRGFVLPTAALMLLVVSLVIGAMLFRTALRTEQVIGSRQDKAIYNAATPAVERAKAKIEYLFNNEENLPGGVPSESIPGGNGLLELMLNKDTDTTKDPYTLPGEERIKIGGKEANAWKFEEDSNGDGETDQTIVYSIIFNVENGSAGGFKELEKSSKEAIQSRANNLIVRSGPLSSKATAGCNLGDATKKSPIENGWFKDTARGGSLVKNFQIDAIAVSNTDDATIAALEMQQERPADRGNKWGARFRYDLEIYPGQPFNWNGAMHTDGSLFSASNRGKDDFRAYLISSPASCLYQAGSDTSSITLGEVEEKKNNKEEVVFRGQLMSGYLSDNVEGGTSYFHVGGGDVPLETHDSAKALVTLKPDTDSVKGYLPEDIALEPVLLFTEDRFRYRNGLKPDTVQDPSWDHEGKSRLGERIELLQGGSQLSVDDFYRADDRYGPKPRYGTGLNEVKLDASKQNGDPITGDDKLTGLRPLLSQLGLDGYWERRAWREGMRVITGQRLELGNNPIPPATDYKGENLDIVKANPNNKDREHETLQRRALRDNPAAVQATAVYHHTKKTGDGQLPVGAIVSTVHPGTAETLKRSASFEKVQGLPLAMKAEYSTLFGGGQFGDTQDELLVDFLSGRGTNGWEFDVEDAFYTDSLTSKAIENLARFSGDPDGAFPPKQDDKIHPYPALTQWGNFSNLRRALLGDGNQSLADSSTRHTAALTMGMLAYNLSYLNGFDYLNNQTRIANTTDPVALTLDKFLQELDDRACNIGYFPPFGTPPAAPNDCSNDNDGIKNGEVVAYPNEDLNRDGDVDFGEDFDGNNNLEPVIPTMVIYAPGERDKPIARVAPSPEAYIAGLEARLQKTAKSAADYIPLQQAVQLGRLISQKEQVNRDRKFGFRPSLFGPDKTQQTIDYATTSTVGGYQYLVKYLYNEDFNGDGKLNSKTASGSLTKLVEVDEVTNTKIGIDANNVKGTTIFEDFDNDNKLDQDFNRNGILDISLTADLNGDNAANIYTVDLNRNNILEDWEKFRGATSAVNNPFIDENFNGGGQLTLAKFGEAQDTNFNKIGTGTNTVKYTLLNEDIDGNGTLTTGTTVDEATLLNPSKPPGTVLTGNQWDVNKDGNISPASDLDEDVDGDGKLYRFQHGGVTYSKGVLFNVGCDFSKTTGNDFFGFGKPTDLASEARFIRLATSLCSTQPKYPSLYYLFPLEDRKRQDVAKDLNGDGVPATPATIQYQGGFDAQPFTDLSEDVNFNGRLDPGEDRPSSVTTNTRDVLDGNPILYISQDGKTLDNYSGFFDEFKALSDTEIADLAIKPKVLSNWVLPYKDLGNRQPCGAQTIGGPNPNCSEFSLIYDGFNDKYYRVAFKDTAFFNGREMMPVRALNMDLELLTDKESGQQKGQIGGDTWIAKGNSNLAEIQEGGIVYAFREDSVREDAVSRPAKSAWNACNTSTKIRSTNCKSKVVNAQDPPVNSANGISPKPVDFYPDPDRRPYGFRLINGTDLSREPLGGTINYGLSFISDNPAYTQGNFNCHSTKSGDCGTTPIEEFPATLSNVKNWGTSQFYDRVSPQYDKFAKPKIDKWRYSEILVDAMTILSSNFCDGSLEDGMVSLADSTVPVNMIPVLGSRGRGGTGNASPTTKEIYGCQNNPTLTYTSYGTQNRPQKSGIPNENDIWLRENPADPGSPIKISANGNPIQAYDEAYVGKGIFGKDYQDNYQKFSDRKGAPQIGVPDATNVNGVLIQGLIPSQAYQSYGGLQNFLRLLERWTNNGALNVAGSLIQLNFSTSSTGLYDQDAWEPAQTPTSGVENTPYYGAPYRSWGYDVALQLSQPGPISSRLLAIGNARSEYYRELPADDPYITNLRCALPKEISDKTGGGCS